jgi:protein-S-isoprenylcysteine O-methyltransferase
MRASSPVILALIAGASELYLNLTKRSRESASRRDRKSLGLILLLNSVGSALAIYLMFKIPAWTFPWRNQLNVLGISLFTLGMAWRWYSIIYLGSFFTTNVVIAADHRLIETGPYRFIRHPSYTGSLLMVVGLGFCMGSILSFLVLVTLFSIALLRRMQIEEGALGEAFGKQYETYIKRTKRLIPLIY